MFRSDCPPLDYIDPFHQPVSERLAALGRGSRHVAYFYGIPDTSTFRYRVLNMIDALALADPDVGAAWFSASDLGHVDAILDRADVVVICRVRYTDGFARMVAAARARGLRVLFDIDDLVFDDRLTHLVMDTLAITPTEDAWDTWFALIARTGAMMRLCDGVILTNSYLASRARDFSKLPTTTVPNFLNAAQLRLSRDILRAKSEAGFAQEGDLVLGYFSGSPSHNRDFAIIAGALAGLMRALPQVRLRLVGFLDVPMMLTDFSDRIERLPLQNILNLQRLVSEVEFNLVPLQDNVFTNCKSELKVFEASVVGTLSVASPSFALRGIIDDGADGYIARSHLWRTTLEEAVARLDEYPEMAAAAAAKALARYTPRSNGDAVLHAVFGDWLTASVPAESDLGLAR